jgi:polyribonucleotide nucleotidyltransferase
MSYIYQADIDGRPLIIETGRLAGQANGSATVAIGETVVLVTACMNTEIRDIDFPADHRLRGAHVRGRQNPGGFPAARAGPPPTRSSPDA